MVSYAAFETNFKSKLVDDLLSIADADAVEVDRAFSKLAARYLGYELSSITVCDGKNDNGIDFYVISGTTYEVFQCKMHDLTDGLRLNTRNFGKDGVDDLSRGLDFLGQVPKFL